jgi:hypothetical protein
MSKSILIMDTPKSCKTCRLRYDNYGQCDVCILADDVVDYYYETDTKPDWCPLSPLPEKIKLRQYVDNADRDMNSVMAYAYAQGRNDCLDEILEGEKR